MAHLWTASGAISNIERSVPKAPDVHAVFAVQKATRHYGANPEITASGTLSNVPEGATIAAQPPHEALIAQFTPTITPIPNGTFKNCVLAMTLGAGIFTGSPTLPMLSDAGIEDRTAPVFTRIHGNDVGWRAIIDELTDIDVVAIQSIADSSSSEADRFLESVYLQDATGDIRGGALSVFGKLDELLRSGAFDECDQILSAVSVARFTSIDVPLSFLTITRAAADRLPHRNTLYHHVRDFVARAKDDTYAAQLLDKMK